MILTWIGIIRNINLMHQLSAEGFQPGGVQQVKVERDSHFGDMFLLQTV